MAHEWLNCRRKKWSYTYAQPRLTNGRTVAGKSKSAIQYLRLATAHEWWNFTEKKCTLLILL